MAAVWMDPHDTHGNPDAAAALAYLKRVLPKAVNYLAFNPITCRFYVHYTLLTPPQIGAIPCAYAYVRGYPTPENVHAVARTILANRYRI